MKKTFKYFSNFNKFTHDIYTYTYIYIKCVYVYKTKICELSKKKQNNKPFDENTNL